MPISPFAEIAMIAGRDFHKGYTLIKLQPQISEATKVGKEGLLESRKTLPQISLLHSTVQPLAADLRFTRP